MLPVDLDTVRLYLHLLAATVWVGGQITLAGLVPALRQVGPDAPRAVARRFNRIAWPAFGVLLVTGVWNLLSVGGPMSGRYAVTLMAKLVVVMVSGLAAWAHAVSTSRRALAIGGALSGSSALVALFLGVVLRG